MSARISRPKLVKALQALWDNEYSKSSYLASAMIGDGSPLRGVRNSKLAFEYPVSVLCGPNGTGKTTFMAISVLAFHGENPMTKPKSYRNYFDFSYFFASSDADKHASGVKISWEYTNGHSDNIEKGVERWMRYIKNNKEPRRPQRGTEFVGLSRIVPAFERRGFSRLFSKTKNSKRQKQNPELATSLSSILCKPYTSVSAFENTDSTGSHKLNRYNSSHTSFNAGAGEECLTRILDCLLQAPEGSFVAIEEIEVGLHPATMEKLVDEILKIALKRKLQILITTHSSEFLRACPKECLVHAERAADKVEFTHKPNVDNAIKSLSGKVDAAVFVVCEDIWAAELVSNCLSKKIRDLVKVAAYGSESELVNKGAAIAQATGKPVAVVWDGDVPDKALKNINFDDKTLFGFILPGGDCPERYLISLFENAAFRKRVIDYYGLSEPEWDNAEAAVKALPDPHDIFYTLQQHVDGQNSGETEILALGKNLCKIASEVDKGSFEELSDAIQDIVKKAAK